MVFYGKNAEINNNLKISNGNKLINLNSLEESMKLIFQDVEVVSNEKTISHIKFSRFKNKTPRNSLELESILFVENEKDECESRVELKTSFGLKIFTDRLPDFYEKCLSINNSLKFSYIAINSDVENVYIKHLSKSSDIKDLLSLIENYYNESNSIVESLIRKIKN